MTITAVVVDDSIVFRKTIRDCLESIGGIQILDVARDGTTAVEKIRRYKPDLVTLDVEMPGMDGLQVLRELQTDHLKSKIVMVSSLTQRGAKATTEALANGAYDFIVKPDRGEPRENVADLTRQLKLRVNTLQRRTETKPPPAKPAIPATAARARNASAIMPPELVLIGISTGGPKALGSMLPSLPADLPTPVVIVQHMPAMFTKSMADDLDRNCALTVHEVEDGMPIKAGQVYIAPGGKQLRLDGVPGSIRAAVTDDPPHDNCKPSVDLMFDSARECVGGNALGIIMTGMGHDGLASCRSLRSCGASIWAQDEATSTVYGMPRKIVIDGLADRILGLSEIGPAITSYCRQHSRKSLSLGTNRG